MYDYIACTFLVMLLAYATASMFMEVFHSAVDTIIMCYITDCEQNSGAPQHADQKLVAFLGQHGALTADHKRLEEVGGNAGPVYTGQPNNDTVAGTIEIAPSSNFGPNLNSVPSNIVA
jgi:Plasma-membrane choline transporter